MTPSEIFARNIWIGASFPSPGEAATFRDIGLDKIMWGSDYPHHESVSPFTTESLRRSFADWPEADLRRIFSENAAAVYGFDLVTLGALAEKIGPTVEEIATPLEAIPAGATSPAFFRD